jgi:hypothetical protein
MTQLNEDNIDSVCEGDTLYYLYSKWTVIKGFISSNTCIEMTLNDSGAILRKSARSLCRGGAYKL